MSEQVLNNNEPADPTLFVDIEALSSDGDVLVSQAAIINQTIINIRKMLGDGWDSWLGEDKEAYVSSLKKEVLNTLDDYSSEVNKVGEYVNRLSRMYDGQLTSSLSELSEYE